MRFPSLVEQHVRIERSKRVWNRLYLVIVSSSVYTRFGVDNHSEYTTFLDGFCGKSDVKL